MARYVVGVTHLGGLFLAGMVLGLMLASVIGVTNHYSSVSEGDASIEGKSFVRASGYPTERACESSQQERGADPVVVIAGPHRSGSTITYNLSNRGITENCKDQTRYLLLEKIRKALETRNPNLVAGYYEELEDIARGFSTEDSSSAYEALKTMQVPLLIKMHIMTHVNSFFGSKSTSAKELGIDKVFVTFRDLRKQVLSAYRMGWVRQMSRESLDAEDFCTTNKHFQEGVTEEEWRKPETWVTQARGLIKCWEKIVAWAGPDNVPVRHEDIPKTFENDVGLAWITRHLAHIPQQKDDLEVQPKTLAKQLDKVKAPACTSRVVLNPSTELHRGHMLVREDYEDFEIEGMQAIAEDPLCRKWLVDRGYIRET